MIRQPFNLKSDSPNGRRDLIGAVFFTVLLLATLYGVYRILQPYMHAIIMAALLASVFYPIYTWILRKTKNRKNLAAGLAVLLVALVVVVPVVLFSVSLVMRGIEAYRQAESWLEPTEMRGAPRNEGYDPRALIGSDSEPPSGDLGDSPVPGFDDTVPAGRELEVSPRFIEFKAERIDPLLESDTGRKLVAFQQAYLPWETRDDRRGMRDRLIDSVGTWVGTLHESAISVLGNIFAVLMSFLLMLFTMFYFFRDGSEWVDSVLDFSPLSEEHEDRLLDNIKKVARSSILGTFLTAVAQGGLGAIAFGICGIPWMFYGVLMGFTSMVPVVGTALVWVPAVIYLLVMGKFGLALFLTIWSVVVVGLADNFLRPALMKGDTGMSSAILFFAILGGISLFGLIGVIYGPLIFGICWVLLQIYDISTRGPEGQLPTLAAATDQAAGDAMSGDADEAEDDSAEPPTATD